VRAGSAHAFVVPGMGERRGAVCGKWQSFLACPEICLRQAPPVYAGMACALAAYEDRCMAAAARGLCIQREHYTHVSGSEAGVCDQMRSHVSVSWTRWGSPTPTDGCARVGMGR